MARVTIEDCSKYVENRFELVLVASQRGKELNHGSKPKIENIKNDKEAIIALREIAANKLSIDSLKKSIVKKTFLENLDNDQEESKDSENVNEEVIAEIDSFKDSPQAVKDNQLFNDEENIKE